MVKVYFQLDGEPVGNFTVSGQSVVDIHGDFDWFDDAMLVNSPRYAQPISIDDDAEEWARSLPDAFAHTSIQASVQENSEPVPGALPRSPPSRGAGWRRRLERVRAYKELLTGVAILIALGVVVLVGTNSSAPTTPHVVPRASATAFKRSR